MIFNSDSADKAIEKTINSLCQELSHLSADDEEFLPTVEAIAKLRASLNPTIIQQSDK